jgi:hypothetical protein
MKPAANGAVDHVRLIGELIACDEFEDIATLKVSSMQARSCNRELYLTGVEQIP